MRGIPDSTLDDRGDGRKEDGSGYLLVPGLPGVWFAMVGFLVVAALVCELCSCGRGLLPDDYSIPLAVGKGCCETLKTTATRLVAMCSGRV